jgi:hypothetical protein
MRMSLSRESVEEGGGADVGGYDIYAWLRLESPDPKATGDSISVIGRCGFSNSSGCGFARRLFPDDDSGPISDWIWRGGVIAWPEEPGAGVGVVRSWACGSEVRGDGSGGAVPMDTLPLLGGGYTSPRAAASCALCCASAFVGLPRFFLFAGSPVDIMLEA